jgi:hypothetical protein
MTEYVCLTLLANPGEGQAAFKARLAAFWTHILRNKPDDYEKVFAEATEFGSDGGRVSRQYMVEAAVIPVILMEVSAALIAHLPIDTTETYTRYEASSPDWFQIDH